MGLGILTSDGEKDFNISYFAFADLKSFFLLHYGEDLYNEYRRLLMSACAHIPQEINISEEEFDKRVGALTILIDHSDCDGELTSEECKLLKDCLFVDEDKIRGVEIYKNNPKFVERVIKLMYEFVDIVEYSANNGVKLLFG